MKKQIAGICSVVLAHGVMATEIANDDTARKTGNPTTQVGSTPKAAVTNENVLPVISVKATADSRPQAENGYQPKRASIASRSDAALIDVPQAVSVVTSQFLQDRQPGSLADALDTVSGVRMGNTLGGTLDAIIKRGFGDNRDNSMLRDGMLSVQPRNFTPTTERVEVLKGPSSMLYGSMDPGGVINVISKKPLLEAQHSVTLSGSSYGGLNEQIDLTGPIGDSGLAYRLIADHRRNNYWRNFGEITQSVVAPSLAWYGRDTTLSFAYEHMNYSVPIDRGTIIDPRTGNPVAVPKERRFDENYNASAGRSDAVNLRFEHQINQDWTVRGGYGFSRSYYNDWQARVLSVNYATGIATRRVDATQNGVQSAHTLTLNAEGKIRWGGILHDIVGGVDYMRNYRVLGDLYRGPSNSQFNIYNPVYGQLTQAGSKISPADSDQTDKLISRGVFLQDSMHLDERWIVLAGLRYEYFNELTGKGRPFKVGSEVAAGRTTPRAGVVYKLAPDWSMYASYSESFKPNTSIATPIGTLPPELAKGYEIGSKLETDNLTATVAVFDIQKRNIQTTETIGGINYTRNAGKARSRGLEMDASGRLTQNLSVVASYAYTEARYADDPKLAGNPLPNTPKHAASLYLTRDFGVSHVGPVEGRIRAGVGARVFSSLPVGDGTGKVYHLPYGRVADAFVSWDTLVAGQAIDWQFNVKNLFDSTYYTASCCSGTPFVNIGAGRELTLSAKLNF
ncbi:Ferrichrome-iron receptor [Collimonas arenae]|uniref:Ferrichrome-iron receptor n=1 Tax=Collimonas arenae TaxID=279058 RepID=A0A0A1FAA3_9BURK|nr:TonB-dependent siderophore receptor [Collimonas arenae]AIY40609.1 Ferrichrome-iron receptor [Collimonas arenae]